MTETLFILVLFTIVFAYVIAYYNEGFSKPKDVSDLSQQTHLVVQVDTNQHNTEDFTAETDDISAIESTSEIAELESNEIIAVPDQQEAVLIENELSDSAQLVAEVEVAENWGDISKLEGSAVEIAELEEGSESIAAPDQQDGMKESAVLLENELSDSTQIVVTAETDDISAIESTNEIAELESNEIIAVPDQQEAVLIENGQLVAEVEIAENWGDISELEGSAVEIAELEEGSESIVAPGQLDSMEESAVLLENELSDSTQIVVIAETDDISAIESTSEITELESNEIIAVPDQQEAVLIENELSDSTQLVAENWGDISELEGSAVEIAELEEGSESVAVPDQQDGMKESAVLLENELSDSTQIVVTAETDDISAIESTNEIAELESNEIIAVPDQQEAVLIENELSDSTQLVAENWDDISELEGSAVEIAELEEGNESIVAPGQLDSMEESAVLLKNKLSESTDEKISFEGDIEIFQIEQESMLPFNSSSNELDNLIDCAFLQKEQKMFTQALASFRQALTLYPSSEAAPFLVMEIGTILKNNGQYDEAINVFCEAKNLPGLQQNNMFKQEFVKTIAYLRIVKNMLSQHQLGFISFNNIPEHVLKEIDAEFREWRKTV